MPSHRNCLMRMMNALAALRLPQGPQLVSMQKQRQTWTRLLEAGKCGWSYTCLRLRHIFLISRPLRLKDKKESVSLVGFAAVDSPSKSAPALASVSTPTPPLTNGYGSPVVVSHIVEQAEHGYFCHSPPASVVERSERTPSPPLLIWYNWADI
jgi:hypothetical protein